MIKENTNGFPLNGGFPDWLISSNCSGCGEKINYSSYKEVGFEINKKNSGKLFVKYKCEHCDNESTIYFGDEIFTIERLATHVIQHSNIMKAAKKNNWIKKHIKENQNDND